jgi:hypothetical protein
VGRETLFLFVFPVIPLGAFQMLKIWSHLYIVCYVTNVVLIERQIHLFLLFSLILLYLITLHVYQYSEQLLFNATRTIFQLYHDENKLHLKEVVKMSALY